MNLLKKTALAVATGAMALATTAPASAQYRGGYHGGYHGGYRGHGDGALVAGIAGLAIGAAIASDHRGYRGGYYDRPYRGDYYYDRGYYRGGYYDDGYYAYRGCYLERRWDPYYGEPVRVRVCR